MKGRKTKSAKKAVAKDEVGKERIDMEVCAMVMENAVRACSDPDARASKEFIAWTHLVREFSEMCRDFKVKSHIAVLGTALLAKATNPRVDVRCLKAGEDSQGAYNARDPAEGVLVPASQKYRFSLGTSGPQPLNNQPFFHAYRIHSGLKVMESKRPVLNRLLVLLHEVTQCRSEEAVRALAAFVDVRRDYWPKYSAVDRSMAVSSAEQLASCVHTLVGEGSEGGARAQAAVGGLIDTLYIAARVRVGKRHEPDRKMPGDVGVRVEGDPGVFSRVFEVRDKNVPMHAAQAFIAKLAAAGVPRGVLVAVASDQVPLDLTALKQRAGDDGVDLEVFTEWNALVRAVVFAAEDRESAVVQKAVVAIRSRLIELEASPATVARWDALTLAVAVSSE